MLWSELCPRKHAFMFLSPALLFVNLLENGAFPEVIKEGEGTPAAEVGVRCRMDQEEKTFLLSSSRQWLRCSPLASGTGKEQTSGVPGQFVSKLSEKPEQADAEENQTAQALVKERGGEKQLKA